jgi:hypothetical protein
MPRRATLQKLLADVLMDKIDIVLTRSAFQHRAGAAEARRAQNSLRVFNFIQTPIVNGRTLLAIEPLSQGDRAFNST